MQRRKRWNKGNNWPLENGTDSDLRRQHLEICGNDVTIAKETTVILLLSSIIRGAVNSGKWVGHFRWVNMLWKWDLLIFDIKYLSAYIHSPVSISLTITT